MDKRYINEPLKFTEKSLEEVLKKEKEQKKKKNPKLNKGGNNEKI